MKTCFKKNKVKIKDFEKNENELKYNKLQSNDFLLTKEVFGPRRLTRELTSV